MLTGAHGLVVAGHTLAAQENRKAVAAVVGCVALPNLDRVVHEEVEECKVALFAVERVAVVPHAVEAQDLAVERKKLAELVKVVWRLGQRAGLLGPPARHRVRVGGCILERVDLDTVGLEEALNVWR